MGTGDGEWEWGVGLGIGDGDGIQKFQENTSFPTKMLPKLQGNLAT